MDTILEIKANYFKSVDYESNSDCVVARAAHDKFKCKDVNVSGTYIYLNNKDLYRMVYDYGMFKQDKAMAESKKFSGDTIRKLTLEKA